MLLLLKKFEELILYMIKQNDEINKFYHYFSYSDHHNINLVYDYFTCSNLIFRL